MIGAYLTLVPLREVYFTQKHPGRVVFLMALHWFEAAILLAGLWHLALMAGPPI
jgi:hypothetical protein